MKQSIQYDGPRYQVILLWEKNKTMPNNNVVAKAQHRSLHRRLQKEKLTMQLYDKLLSTDIDKNYLIPVVSFIRLRYDYVTYLTLRLYTPRNLANSTCNKCCIETPVSLISCVETGSDLLRNMSDLLRSFRAKKIVVSCEIKGMFMQIGKTEDNQNLLRFSWPTRQGVKQHQCLCLVFGAECSSAVDIFATTNSRRHLQQRTQHTATNSLQLLNG